LVCCVSSSAAPISSADTRGYVKVGLFTDVPWIPLASGNHKLDKLMGPLISEYFTQKKRSQVKEKVKRENPDSNKSVIPAKKLKTEADQEVSSPTPPESAGGVDTASDSFQGVEDDEELMANSWHQEEPILTQEEAFGSAPGAPLATLSSSIVDRFDPVTIDPTLFPSATAGFAAPPPLPALPPALKKALGRANKENMPLGNRAPQGSGKFCIGNYKGKTTGKALYALAWLVVPGNKTRLTSDFNQAWDNLPSNEKAGYEAQGATLKAAAALNL
ncbi:hypothetical protein EST38_g13146, partial [Candolleomyces aberdarensis]